MILYRALQRLVRTTRPLIGELEIEGIERIPSSGPFLLVANHQSILDPILIQGICPRPIHTMAKSTQFASPLFAWFMPRILSFPVRRYQVDAQAVRIVLRRLAAGEPVGIYIEGERSWDGRLQAPRRGTVRLILKAGVPVLPCTIQGSYDAWPRWHHTLRRARIRITFGEPLAFPQLDRRDEREAALAEASARIMEALASQLARAGGHPARVRAGAE